jgi:formylglycine-generating enzyme required for sulfatase activity
MKLFLLLLLTSVIALAETPEVIYPKTKVIKPIEWYAHQAELWQRESARTTTDEKVWLNYYAAARYAQWDAASLTSIVESINSKIPNTYTALLVKGIHEGYTKNGYETVRQAFEKDPQNVNSFGPMMLLSELTGDVSGRMDFSRRYYDSHIVSFGLLNYSYNVLMSLEPNSILVIENDNATIPVFLVQDVLKVRNDVVVLCLDLLMNDAYREMTLRNLALRSTPALNGQVTHKDLCNALTAANAERKFYFALTLGKENITDLKDQLYVVGLASRVSSKRIDNISIIKENLEKHFLLDYIAVDFNGEGRDAAGKVLGANYLVSMLMLADHYRSSGEKEKLVSIEALITKIADQSSKTAMVNQYLGKAAAVPAFIPANADLKALEGLLKQVKDNVYAHEYEVTNIQYGEFLQYLKANGKTDLYEKCRIHLERYEEPALSLMMNYHSSRPPVKKEKSFANYPIINVTYEAANEYCAWLTEQYNHSATKKYKKVVYRLPTVEEWQLAAAGVKKPVSWKLSENRVEVKIYEDGREYSKKFTTKTVSLDDPEILYPWYVNFNFRNKALNSKGCSLGNFKYPETQKPCTDKIQGADGFWMTAFVQAYFPNEIGLYDVVGNVAEMTQEKGKACGGSWNHSPEESTIKSINSYEGPGPEIGFRVFMEVIEQ